MSGISPSSRRPATDSPISDPEESGRESAERRGPHRITAMERSSATCGRWMRGSMLQMYLHAVRATFHRPQAGKSVMPVTQDVRNFAVWQMAVVDSVFVEVWVWS
jgi:hypothetical protein